MIRLSALLGIVLVLIGCGSLVDPASLVDPRCKTGAMCNSMDQVSAMEYWKKNYPLTMWDKMEANATGIPNQWIQERFETWYFTGKHDR